MEKIFAVVSLMGLLMLGSCSDFLDETPDKSGSAYIYHMDQLYGLMGSTDLYLLDQPDGWVPAYMTETLPLTDAVEYSPAYYVDALMSSMSEVYDTYCWKGERLMTESSMLATWTPVWERIYRFNTVLENLDKVEQTTEAIRKQVEGEARFGRAYYHFMLLVQYCLWADDKPGIGYRDNAEVGEVPPRKTVAYTLECIYEDLDLAEKALTEAGRTAFDREHNFRPTVPTVQALRARIALYRGDYELALTNAENALKAHNTLVDFKNDPNYELYPYMDVHLLDEAGETMEVISIYSMDNLMYLDMEAVTNYEEAYLPNSTMEDYEWYHPMSEVFYNLWDKENDARWKYFYSACNPLQVDFNLEIDEDTWNYVLTYENHKDLKPWNFRNYYRFVGTIIGMTTAEMYLIKAECQARSGDEPGAAETLKTLRRTRFLNDVAAENIGGTVQEVLDERFREIGAVGRFYDIKRLNGAENAGICIRRDIMTNPTDKTSVVQLEIAPDDPRWALPFYSFEAASMGWEQNAGWE